MDKAAPDEIFRFDGGAASYWGLFLLGALVTFCTFGFATPWVLCWTQKWRCAHTTIGGRRLQFTGNGFSLIGLWLKWVLFTCLTLGIYLIWVIPNYNRWVVEHTRFA